MFLQQQKVSVIVRSVLTKKELEYKAKQQSELLLVLYIYGSVIVNRVHLPSFKCVNINR